MFRSIEQLEERRLMAGDFDLPNRNLEIFLPLPTPLVIDGTAASDSILISRDLSGNINVTKNGVLTNTIWEAWVSKIVVNAYDGNDYVSTYSNVTRLVEINGGNGNDTLYGSVHNDLIQGAGGTDYIYGNLGNDNLDGGVGGVAYYFENTGSDSVFGAAGDDVINASDYGSCYLSGGDGNDLVYGWQGNDRMYGDWGNDSLYGYIGADEVYGGPGNDFMSTGDGNDLVRGGSDNDTVYAGAGDDAVHGDAGDDHLYGQDGHDKIYGGAGCDVLAGGNGNDTLVSIGGNQNDCLYGEGGYDSFWADSEGTETIWDADWWEINNGHVHRVGSFMNYTYKNGSPWPWDWTNLAVSRELNGQNFADPIGGANYQNFSNRPLFAAGGPNKDDIDQGGLGDCYFLASLGSVAKVNPDRIRQHIVELGDGTYAVQFSNTFIRLDGDLPTNGSGSLVYAGLGTGNSLWTAIMEKAFAYYRHGDSNYASIEYGWMDEGYSAMGVGTNTLNVDGWYKLWNNSNNLWDYVNGELAAGKAVTIGTPGGSPDLVGGHAYMVDRVYVDGYGTRRVVLRNPWGAAGSPAAYVDISASQFYNSISRVQSAWA